MAKSNKYVKLTQREHILKRSETYVGSKNTEKIKMYVIKDNDLSNIEVEKRDVNNNPAFIKLFDEILTNASDHAIRTDKVKMIKVIIEDKKIVVENDGDTIPIKIHPEEGVYNAELIFSHLLTGENYDDTEERVVGGRNGLGAKLVNVFSKKFKVECCDGKQLYRQWTKNNMLDIEEPEILKAPTGSKKFTRITYYPDYDQFDFDHLTEDLRSIMYKRCLDVAAYIPKVRVSVDGKTIPVKRVSDWMKMHLPEDAEFFHETYDNGWEVGIAKSTEHGFESVSIVNGISTHKGGTHVNHIALDISKKISSKMKKIDWPFVKNKLFLFLISQVPNPTFDTQTKENLTNRMTVDIHQNSEMSDSMLRKIMKSEIVQSIVDEQEMREKLQLKRMGGGKKSTINLPKLQDANKAGTRESDKCHLFLCEGDCIHYDTEVLIFRDGSKKTIKAKDLEIGDGVITHKSNISVISGITKKINKGLKLKTDLGDMIFGENHRLFIYDKVKDEFRFESISNIDKNYHQLVKNRNVFFENLVEIKNIKNIDDVKYDKIITIEGNEEILSTDSHKFCCLNKDNQYFKMIECQNINPSEWYLVNYEKI